MLERKVTELKKKVEISHPVLRGSCLLSKSKQRITFKVKFIKQNGELSCSLSSQQQQEKLKTFFSLPKDLNKENDNLLKDMYIGRDPFMLQFS